MQRRLTFYLLVLLVCSATLQGQWPVDVQTSGTNDDADVRQNSSRRVNIVLDGIEVSDRAPIPPLRTFPSTTGVDGSTQAHYCVNRDERGFVWSCTDQGLERFDGRRFVTFGIDAGLTSGPLYTMTRTSDGRLWVGGPSGVYEFRFGLDGGRFVQVPAPKGVEVGIVHVLITSEGGGVWCGSSKGLFRLTMDGEVPRLVPVPLHVDVVRRLDTDPFALPDVAQIDSAYRLRDRLADAPTTNRNELHVAAIFHREPEILSLAEDEKTLWIGSPDGLIRRSPDGQTRTFSTRDGLPSNTIRALTFAERRELWAGTPLGLAGIDVGALGRKPVAIRLVTQSHGLPANSVLSLDTQHRILLVGTTDGLAQVATDFDSRRPFVFVVFEQRRGVEVNGMVSDRLGNIWLATTKGLREVVQPHFLSVDSAQPFFPGQPSLWPARVGRLFTAGNDLCAIRTDNSVLPWCRHRGVPYVLREHDDLPSTLRATGRLAAQDYRGGWFLVSQAGVVQFSGADADGVLGPRIDALYGDSFGIDGGTVTDLFADSLDGVWVAGSHPSRRLARIDPWMHTVEWFGSSHALPTELPPVTAFVEDAKLQMWIALGDELLFRYLIGGPGDIIPLGPGRNGGKSAPSPKSQPGVAAPAITAMAASLRGGVWLWSTSRGLGEIDPFSSVDQRPLIRWHGGVDTLRGESVTALVMTDSDAVLVGTDKTIWQFTPATNHFERYNETDGVPPSGVRQAIRSNHEVYFLSGDGKLFNWEDVPSRRSATFVTAVQVDDARRDVRADGDTDIAGVALAASARSLSIEWATPDTGLQPLHHEWRLLRVSETETTSTAVDANGRSDGPSATTIDQSHLIGSEVGVAVVTNDLAPYVHTIDLEKLEPGAYRFVVHSVQPDGTPGEAARLDFTRLAPPVPVAAWWIRWWFLGPIGIVLVLAAYGLRVRQLRQVARIRAGIASDLHDSVGAGLSRISILSDLVRQQAETQLPDALPALDSIGDNARNLFRDMTDAVWLIESDFDDVGGLAVRLRDLASELFDDAPVKWSVEVSDDATGVVLPPDHRRHLYLIAKEALTNVHRHAHASVVAVNIAVRGKRLDLEILDDGVGIAAATAEHSGRGMNNMGRRAATIGGTLTVEGASPTGTRVHLTVAL
jgi:ligand-binding sensor domain-containing protein/two-component sensor histidine kinase